MYARQSGFKYTNSSRVSHIPMRILHISTRLILGGSQENTVLSCEGQARRGHEVHLAFGPIYGPEGSLLERVEKFRTPGGGRIQTHVVPNLVREISPGADMRAYRELRRLVRELKPEIVHTHSSKAGILGRAAAWDEYMRDINIDPAPAQDVFLWGCGVVHTIHGPPFMPVEGELLGRVSTRAKNFMYTLAERFAANKCHAIVSVADAMTRQFLERRIGRGDQYTTVYSGMETATFLEPTLGQDRPRMRRRLGLATDDVVIGTVARLAEHKGHDDLLDALGEELKRRPNLKLLWVGDGWWRERLVARAREMGLAVAQLDAHAESERDPATEGGESASIILTGLVPPERVPGLIRAMDVLAHPSYREGLPRTVPQALLCGVCPLAYDVDGTGEICRDMETGRLVAVGDRAALRDAAVWLIDHPTERAALAARGRAECADKFAVERMVDGLEKVYARALKGDAVAS